MKYIKYLLIGILFGVVMTKSEAISWFRIQEMFRFQSFHMYGIIGTAVGAGLIVVWAIKRFKLKDIYGQPIIFQDKDKSFWRYFLGGTVFGLGWAMTGACPGPIFVLIGHGYMLLIVVLLSSIVGTYLYGVMRDRLPH